MEQLETPLDDVIFIAGSTQAGRRAALDAFGDALPAGVVGKFQLDRVIHATLVLTNSASDPRAVAVALVQSLHGQSDHAELGRWGLG